MRASLSFLPSRRAGWSLSLSGDTIVTPFWHIVAMRRPVSTAHTVTLSLHVRLGPTSRRCRSEHPFQDTLGSVGTPSRKHLRGRHGNARMIVWIWAASGPAADACGITSTAEAARGAAGSLVTSGQAEAARVEQAAVVLGSTLTYDYCLTGETWAARLT